MCSLLTLLTTFLIFICLTSSENNNDGIRRLLKTTTTTSAPAPILTGVKLGSAGDFVILSSTGITSVYKSTITGNIGTSPITGAAMTLFCDEVTGIIYSVDNAGPLCKIISATMLGIAVNDMKAAYNDAAGRLNPNFLNLGTGSIGGLSLKPGLYKWTSSVNIAADISMNGTSSANDVWIFQISGTLIMSSAVKIILINGALAKNIYWQVSGAVTLNTMSEFEGNILGKVGINLKTSAKLNGRCLAQTAVTLQQNAITKSV